MKLETFSITKFRSITEAHKIKLDNISTLVGKNNEGKSNILKALNISMNILKTHGGKRRISTFLRRKRDEENNYFWDRDFPIKLKGTRKRQYTVFLLEFFLTDDEAIEFKNETGLNTNGNITIEITIGNDDNPDINIKKKGGHGWKKKSKEISEYIANRIHFTYIPAIRTDNHAIEIVEKMISLELSKIEENTDYKKAMDIINNLQKPILENISSKIEKSLKNFIPDIKEVETNTIEYRRRMSLRRDCEIIIDDGNKTKLEYKGDGVKSLVALSLLKDSKIGTGFSLIAIEEPESHLHPGAIHSLRESIYDLGESNQVIIATHNPLFVNTDSIKSNIIVSLGNAKIAKNIGEVRKILGVKVSDNLTSASFILVVEGVEDEIALRYLLNYFSPKIKKALNSKILYIGTLGGAGKLSYKLDLYKSQLCKYHVLLDFDQAGKQAYEKAENDLLLDVKRITYAKSRGYPESEFEDLLNPEIYKESLNYEFGVDIDTKTFLNDKRKWSKKIEGIFNENGKPYSKKTEEKLKSLVANSIKGNENIALLHYNKNIIENLIKSVEEMILPSENN